MNGRDERSRVIKSSHQSLISLLLKKELMKESIALPTPLFLIFIFIFQKHLPKALNPSFLLLARESASFAGLINLKLAL